MILSTTARERARKALPLVAKGLPLVTTAPETTTDGLKRLAPALADVLVRTGPKAPKAKGPALVLGFDHYYVNPDAPIGNYARPVLAPCLPTAPDSGQYKYLGYVVNEQRAKACPDIPGLMSTRWTLEQAQRFTKAHQWKGYNNDNLPSVIPGGVSWSFPKAPKALTEWTIVVTDGLPLPDACILGPAIRTERRADIDPWQGMEDVLPKSIGEVSSSHALAQWERPSEVTKGLPLVIRWTDHCPLGQGHHHSVGEMWVLPDGLQGPVLAPKADQGPEFHGKPQRVTFHQRTDQGPESTRGQYVAKMVPSAFTGPDIWSVMPDGRTRALGGSGSSCRVLAPNHSVAMGLVDNQTTKATKATEWWTSANDGTKALTTAPRAAKAKGPALTGGSVVSPLTGVRHALGKAPRKAKATRAPKAPAKATRAPKALPLGNITPRPSMLDLEATIASLMDQAKAKG